MPRKSEKKHKKQAEAVTMTPTTQYYAQSIGPVGQIWLVSLAILLALPTIIAPIFTKYGYSPDLHMAAMIQVGGLALVGCFFFAHKSKRTIAYIHSPLVLPIVLFYTWALLSIFWAHNRFESTITLLDWGAGAMIFFLVSQSVRKPEEVKLLVQAIFIVGLAMAFLGVCQYLYDVQWVQQHAAPSATFNNKNMAAQFGVLTFPLGMGLFLQAQKRLEYWFYAFASGVMFLFVMYTFTRNAYLNIAGIALGLVVYLLIDYFKGSLVRLPRGKKVAAFAATALTVFALMWDSNGWKGAEYFSELASDAKSIQTHAKLDGTGVPRIAMWFNSLEMIKDHMFTGVGAGNWMVYYPMYQTAGRIDFEMSESIQHINAHNDYVEVLSDLGIIGFSFLLLLIFQLFRTALMTYYKWVDNPNRFLVLGMLLCCMGIGINAFFSFPLKQPAPIMIFFAYLGLLTAEYARCYNIKVKQFSMNSGRALMFSGVFALATTFALVLHYQWNQSEIHFRLATISSHQQNYHRMKKEGQSSFDALPYRSRMLNFVGMGHLRLGNPKSAAKYLEMVKDAYPHRNNTLQNLGFIYLELSQDARRRGDTEGYRKYLIEARDNFEHLVNIRPDNARAHRNLGITYSRLNELEKAYIHLETSLAINETRNTKIRGDDQIRQLSQRIKRAISKPNS